MAIPLSEIPTTELLDDLYDAAGDATLCRMALAQGIQEDRSGDSVQGRLDSNRRQIKVISEELDRRGIHHADYSNV